MKIFALIAALMLSPLSANMSLAQSAGAVQAEAKLEQYSAEATDLKALAAQGTTVVFFFATWCPNCVMTLTELSQNWSKVDPSITLVIADYDTERDLKAEFGVTYQDTFVLLDAQGNAAKLWNAGGIEGLNANAGVK